jgi:DNA-binding LytR/AlgR family response regulator
MKMLKIAVVDDEKEARDKMMEFLNRYADANKITFSVNCFENAISFLEGYKADYDIVFLDIQLPDYDGIETAKKIRKSDTCTIIIFVTNMANLAIKCYEVDALDFVVKPFEYFSFSVKLDRAISRIESERDKEVLISTANGIIKIDAAAIQYVEVMAHTLVYHTIDGDHAGYGSLSKVEESLKDCGFSRCNSCYLVNLRYIQKIDGFDLYLYRGGGMQPIRLAISHSKKKDLMKALTQYVGKGSSYVL